MTDMRSAIVPRSDQLNTDDLIGGERTITITRVTVSPGEQPVSVYFEGDNNKPWKPCKSMSRVLVEAWGPDANVYAGRRVTLYRDPKVKWGGLEVGGIRVSHLSHIPRDIVTALTETRGKRVPYLVKALKDEPARQAQPPAPKAPSKVEKGVTDLLALIAAAETIEELNRKLGAPAIDRQLGWLKVNAPAEYERVERAIQERRDALVDTHERQPGEDEL